MAPEALETHDVVCPHCHKEFTGQVLGADGHRGYKCPHCRLFVPFERADEQQRV